MTDISHHCPQAGTLRLVVQGPLTIYDAQALKNRLLELLSEVPLQALELDLAQVPEIDTSGVQWLLLAAREAQRYQASVRTLAARLCCTSRKADEITPAPDAAMPWHPRAPCSGARVA